MILIGQDALGGWAWMLIDVDTRELIESGHSLSDMHAALRLAEAAWAEALARGERVRKIPTIFFPDRYR